MKIGKVLRQQRISLGKTLEAIAFLATTDAGNLSRIERDEQRPSLDLLQDIARALKLKVSDIFLQAENQADQVQELPESYSAQGNGDAELAKQVNQLTRHFCSLSAEDRLLALNMVQMLRKAHSTQNEKQ